MYTRIPLYSKSRATKIHHLPAQTIQEVTFFVHISCHAHYPLSEFQYFQQIQSSKRNVKCYFNVCLVLPSEHRTPDGRRMGISLSFMSRAPKKHPVKLCVPELCQGFKKGLPFLYLAFYSQNNRLKTLITIKRLHTFCLMLNMG